MGTAEANIQGEQTQFKLESKRKNARELLK